MSETFSKSILKVGTYHSPDGEVVVTPERLKHWETQVNRLRSVGYAIPSHFDHSSEIDLLEPIAMDVLERKQNRSAAATVGRLQSFRVTPDGKAAEIVLSTLTPKAKEVVESNAVFVSPVIFPEWKDGAGNTYSDVITSFDLVDHPVDYTQTSFQPSTAIVRCAIRMSAIPMAKEVKQTVRHRDAKARQARFQAAVRMGLDDDPATDPSDQTGASSDAPPAEDTSSTEQTQGPDVLDSVLNLLGEYGVALPPDTTDDNLVDNLRVALTALLGSRDASGDDSANDDLSSDSTSSTPVEATPAIAAMSVQAKAAYAFAESAYKKQLGDRLASAVRSGRCTPAQADSQKRALSVVRLSLNANGTAAKSDLEKWLDWAESVPQGTFWTDEQRTAAAQRLSVVEPRTEWTSTGGMTQAEVDAAVKAIGGRV